MSNKYHEFIEEDAEEASFFDKLVLLVLKHEDGKSRATRIQKFGLIVNSVYEGKTPSSHGAFYFGGFSDNIEESINQLIENGIIKYEHNQYILTDYGKEVLKYLERKGEPDFQKLKRIADTILPALKNLSDRDLIKLTYLLFPELTSKSLIKKEVLEVTEKKIGDLHIFITSLHKRKENKGVVT